MYFCATFQNLLTLFLTQLSDRICVSFLRVWQRSITDWKTWKGWVQLDVWYHNNKRLVWRKKVNKPISQHTTSITSTAADNVDSWMSACFCFPVETRLSSQEEAVQRTSAKAFPRQTFGENLRPRSLLVHLNNLSQWCQNSWGWTLTGCDLAEEKNDLSFIFFSFAALNCKSSAHIQWPSHRPHSHWTSTLVLTLMFTAPGLLLQLSE